MKKIIAIVLFSINCFISYGQLPTIVYIKYEKDVILRPAKIRGYEFASFPSQNGIEKFAVRDSAEIVMIDQFFMTILSDTIYENIFPDVTQQIIISRSNGTYDMLFTDGVQAMEINGRAVHFNSGMQNYINLLIRKHQSLKK